MMTRRIHTTTHNSPLKFYKVITFCFLIITIVLLGVVIFIISKKATIVVVAKEDNKAVQVIANVTSETRGAGSTITGTITTTQFSWSKTYSARSTKSVEGISQGELIVYNKINSPITLIPKTRFITTGGIIFRLKTYTTIPAFGERVVDVYADQPGKASDISPTQFTLPGLPPDRQKYTYAVSTKPMTGGENQVGVLSQDDLVVAENKYKEDVKEKFLSEYGSSISSSNKFVFTPIDQIVTSSQSVGSEVTDFTVSGTTTFVVVFYNSEELHQLVNKEISQQIDPTIDKVVPLSKDLVVSVSSYDKENQTAQITASQSVILTTEANVEKLAPQHFLGMSKEDIKKYILSLDHVAGVEVKFSPYWIRSAPEVSDKIKVTVKNIK